jgi:hypothetical protein
MAVTTGTSVVFKRRDGSSGCWKPTQILERCFFGGYNRCNGGPPITGPPHFRPSRRRDEMSRHRTAKKAYLQPCDGQHDGQERGPEAAALCENNEDGQSDDGPDRWKDGEYFKAHSKHCAEKCAENHEHYHDKALISAPHFEVSTEVIIKLLSSTETNQPSSKTLYCNALLQYCSAVETRSSSPMFA